MALPAAPTIRRIGALSLVLGLLLSFTAISVGAPAGAATTTPICNNQSAAGPNCVGTAYHGTLTAEIQANGDLKFTIVGNSGFVGWNEIKICIPQVGPTSSADCTGGDPQIVSPTQYELSGVSGAQEFDKNVTFTCDTNFTALVAKAAFPSTPQPTYTVHLTPCNGGTDEAFGTADAFVATTTTTAPTTTTTAPTTTTTAPTTTTTTAPTTTTTAPTTTTTTAPTTTTTTAPTTTTTTAPTTTTTAPTTTTTAPTTTTTAPTTTTTAAGATTTTTAAGATTTTTAAGRSTDTTPTTAGGTGGASTGATVAGVVLSREAAAAAQTPAAPAAQVSPSRLARTGFASPVLMALGVALMLLGYFAITIAGRRELAPGLVSPASTTPARADHRPVAARPVAILAGLLAVGTALGRHRH